MRQRFMWPLTAACALVVVVFPTSAPPQAACAPELRAYTVNQGLNSHARIIRGKQTLVRLYLGLGTCANIANGAYAEIRAATLKVKNGTTVLPGAEAIPTTPATLGHDAVGTDPATFPVVTTAGTPTLADMPGDLKFVVPGSSLAPTTTGTWTATFEATLTYKFAATSTTPLPSTSSTVTLTKIAGTNTLITKPVDKRTRALRVLAVPIKTAPMSPAATDVWQTAARTATRILPVPDGTQAAATVGAALPTTGGFRYAINGGAVNVNSLIPSGQTRLCATGTNWPTIKSSLASFLQAYNAANPGNPADKVVGVADPADMIGTAENSTCAEGFASTNSPEAMIRATPGSGGATASLELCHTFGCVPSGFSDGGYHAVHTNADWSPGDANRAYNVTDAQFLANDKTVMKFQTSGWDNSNTVLEPGDYGYGFVACKLEGSTTASACRRAGTTGTTVGVAASGVTSFVMTGRVTKPATGPPTLAGVPLSYTASTLPMEDPDSAFRLLEKNGAGAVVKDCGALIAFDDSVHHSDHAFETSGTSSFSVACPLASGVASFQLVHRPAGGATTVLHTVSATGQAPTITAGGGGPVITGGGSGLTIASDSTSAITVDTTKGGQPTQPFVTAAVSFADIASGGPLTNVYVGNDLSCQVRHQTDGTTGEFFPPSTIPADCGTFLAVDDVDADVLYAPDFASHGTTATANLGTYTPFTAISQTAVTGSGTSADPYTVVTTADAGGSGLRIVQTDKYVVGEEAYRTDIRIQNTSAAARDVILYRAGDCFLGASDLGFGLVDAPTKAVACRGVVSATEPSNRIEQWLPITSGNNYYEANFSEVWSAIGSKTPFPDTCECEEFQDNGAGISWNVSVPPEGEVTRSHLTRIVVQEAQEVTFTASDADTNSCDLRANLLLKRPGSGTTGGGFDVLAAGLDPAPTACGSGSPALFDFEATTGCSGCEIWAFVYDGNFTATAKIEDSEVTAPEDPVASINSPVPAARFYPTEAIVLEGDGFDNQDGPIPDADTDWTSPLFAGTNGRRVVLQPPAAGWTPGTYDITLTVTDSDGNMDAKTVPITILVDKDGDHIEESLDFANGCAAGADGNRLNVAADADGDGKKNTDERYTENGPCTDESSYQAQDAVWRPDPFDSSISSGSIFVTNIYVPDAPAQVPRDGISITAINGLSVAGCRPMRAVSQSFVNNVYAVRFEAEKFASCVRQLDLHNQRVVVEITGDGGSFAWVAEVSPFIK
jgi:hypothetical protein